MNCFEYLQYFEPINTLESLKQFLCEFLFEILNVQILYKQSIILIYIILISVFFFNPNCETTLNLSAYVWKLSHICISNQTFMNTHVCIYHV